MNIDGNWNITATKTPIGDVTVTANLKSSGSKLTGTGHAAGVSAAFHDGTVNGDSFSGKLSITTPISLHLNFTGKVSGNSMSGEISAGAFGSFHFTGVRA